MDRAGRTKNPLAETKVIPANGAVSSPPVWWASGVAVPKQRPADVLRVTTPLASTARFHLLTSFQKHGWTIFRPGANQKGRKIVRKGSFATRHREPTDPLFLREKSPTRENSTREIPAGDNPQGNPAEGRQLVNGHRKRIRGRWDRRAAATGGSRGNVRIRSRRSISPLWEAPTLTGRQINLVEHDHEDIAGGKRIHRSRTCLGTRREIAGDRQDPGPALSHPSIDLAFHFRNLGINTLEDLDLLHRRGRRDGMRDGRRSLENGSHKMNRNDR